MAAPPEKIHFLRQLLADRFGQGSPLEKAESFSTGLEALDRCDIPRGAISEIVTDPKSGPGGSLLLYSLLHASIQKGNRVILIDGKRGFDPKGLDPEELRRILWIRCKNASDAVKATDLSVRDGNVPFIVLLLSLNAPSELRRIPSTAWHRLQMLAEQSAVTLIAFTSYAQIGCARLRLSVGGAYPLAQLHVCRDELIEQLKIKIERRRINAGRRDDEELRRPLCA